MKRYPLIACRVAIEKTQAQVAQDLQLSEVYVRKIEAGDKKPGRETIIKFARYYQKSVTELFPDLFAEE
ncbi:helix-turn-helix transcriptional regulator [Tumebacillus permanentifrigoris]|uniref:Helix-turn-helix protein n=1 Tax=Tumebacillus permanentifrigoris TaxID=378543 RepID=A0A316D9D0_9BACL|nr:helix-turn-helix transcriptional regulator [Tumebacillus permanentifrigoris]PWK13120.1 helix-turn-helix protein [Tumebacillus permanentifrigoris]